MSKRTLLILLLAASTYASPAGILTWTGDPLLGIYPPGIGTIADPNGISSFGSDYQYLWSASVNYDITRSFAVLAAGDFQLSDSVSATASGSPVSPVGQIGGLSLTLTGFGAIAGVVDPVAGSASEAAPPGSEGPYGAASQLPPPFYPVSVLDSASMIVFLEPGNYSLWQDINASASSMDGTTLQLSYSSDLVGVDPPDPTPEPNTLWMMLVFMAGVYVLRRRDAKRCSHGLD